MSLTAEQRRLSLALNGVGLVLPVPDGVTETKDQAALVYSYYFVVEPVRVCENLVQRRSIALNVIGLVLPCPFDQSITQEDRATMAYSYVVAPSDVPDIPDIPDPQPPLVVAPLPPGQIICVVTPRAVVAERCSTGTAATKDSRSGEVATRIGRLNRKGRC